MSSRALLHRPGVLLVVALCAVAAIVSILGKLAGGPDAALKSVALPNLRGAEAYPAFSPDRKRLVYSVRAGKEEAFHLFIRNLPYGDRWQLTAAEGSDTGPAWSPDGVNIAFLRVEDGRGECLVAPAEGGNATKLADCGVETDPPLPAVAWTPDGKSLVVSTVAENQPPAVALVPASGGLPKRLTEPQQGTQGDSTPAVSPDGKQLAFVRSSAETGVNTSSAGADIYLCPLAGGKAQRVTFDDRPIRGLAWTTDGAYIIYAGFRMGSWRLWRLPAIGGVPRDLGFADKSAQYPAIGPGKGGLVYTLSPSESAIWRAPLAKDGGEGQSFIRSTGRESSPAYSPDGSKIANVSDQSGFDEIWVSDGDGGHRTQITHFKGNQRLGRIRWSPDGSTLLFELRADGPGEVDAVPSTGGQPKRLLISARGPAWSHDGKTIYYETRGQIWKAAADGSNQQVLAGQEGSGSPEESPDGKWVYFGRFGSIWRVPTDGGGQEEEVMRPEEGAMVGGGPVTPNGMYYVAWNRRRRVEEPSGSGGGRRGRMRAMFMGVASAAFYDFSKRRSSIVLELPSGDLSTFSLSPDGQYILYPRVDESDTSLMLVEGFK